MALSNRGRRVNDFTNIINLHGSLEKYFGITNENGTEFKTKINIQTLDGFNQFEINLDIIIIHNYKIYNLNNLPLDINSLIASYYTPNYIHLKIQITSPEDYPFNPPIWKIISVKHSLKINLYEYYKYIVDSHNEIMKDSWSPAIKIDVDILYFISKINHFEHLFNYEE
jgi:ubiquitin-protein ligase